MRNAILGLLMVLMLATIIITGCKTTTTDPIIIDTMTENPIVDVQMNDSQVTEQIVPIENESILSLNETIDNTTILVDPVAIPESEYSEYRDTDFIDESIDDLQSLN